MLLFFLLVRQTYIALVLWRRYAVKNLFSYYWCFYPYHIYFGDVFILKQMFPYFSEAEGRRDDNKSSGSGIIKLGAIRDIMDKVK